MYSLFRILGYSTIEMVQKIAQGNIVSAELVQQFQQFSPANNLGDVLRVLRHEDSHIAPLYFVLGNLWLSLWGDSAVALRSMSVIFSLATLPGLYWLCMELFGDRLVAKCAVALMAISPISLVFAQEARFYALWLGLLIYAGAALLHALRCNTHRSWAAFVLLATLALYTNLLSVIPITAYSLYAIAVHVKRDRYLAIKAVTACTGSLLAFSPWLAIYLGREQLQTDELTDVQTSLPAVAKHWLMLMSRGLMDFNLNGHTKPVILGFVALMTLGVCVLVAHSFYRLVRATAPRVWLFVLTLLLAMPVGVFNQILSTRMPPRYLLPMYLGMLLPLAYVAALSLKGGRVPGWLKVTRMGVIGVVVTSIFASGMMVRSEVWWNKQFSNCNPAIARFVNQAEKPLIISDGTGQVFFDHALSNVISLSRLVKPNVAFQLTIEGKTPVIPETGYSDRFVLTPSASLLSWLKGQYGDRLVKVHQSVSDYRGSDVCLWRIR
ncbi:MAG: hypothetical protein HC860_25415 [Alkalinema sp. RU_4_3]|nr:hypothetical protein [Alkalinema sp. RU_4_3]